MRNIKRETALKRKRERETQTVRERERDSSGVYLINPWAQRNEAKKVCMRNITRESAFSEGERQTEKEGERERERET